MNAIDLHFLLKQVKFLGSDKPWVSHNTYRAVEDFTKQNQWRYQKKKKTFMLTRLVTNLPKNDCKRWCDIVSKLSCRTKKSSNTRLNRDGKKFSESELVSTLNRFFYFGEADIPPLDVSPHPAYIFTHPTFHLLSSHLKFVNNYQVWM
jgi:hypothetical protein